MADPPTTSLTFPHIADVLEEIWPELRFGVLKDPEPVPQTGLGPALKPYRLKAGMTWYEAAAASDVPVSAVIGYERGFIYSIPRLERLCAAYGIGVDELRAAARAGVMVPVESYGVGDKIYEGEEMSKKQVTAKEFYRLWNEEIRGHPEYVDGTKIVPFVGGGWFVDSPKRDVTKDHVSIVESMEMVSEKYDFDD